MLLLRDSSSLAALVSIFVVDSWFRSTSSQPMSKLPNTSVASKCLLKHAPTLIFKYPVDAKEHWNSIEHLMDKVMPERHALMHNLSVCWHWMQQHPCAMNVEALWFKERATYDSSPELFGHHIPLFIPWGSLSRDTLFEVLSHLRRDVPYVTVSMRDQGIGNSCNVLQEVRNILVLSSGGYGHIALPYLSDTSILTPFTEFHRRSMLISFVGSYDGDDWPYSFRRELCERLRLLSISMTFRAKLCTSASAWATVAADSRVSLAPRGLGRNTLRLGELMQAGFLPLVIYDDYPFVPYPHLFRKIGWITDLPRLNLTISSILLTSEAEMNRRHQRLLDIAQTHLTIDGLRTQIFLYLSDGSGDLECNIELRNCPYTCYGHVPTYIISSSSPCKASVLKV